MAGRLWRSDDYGRAGSWKDITTLLPGAPDAGVAAGSLALTVVEQCSPDTCLTWLGALTPEPGADTDAAGVMEVVYDDTHPDRLLVLGAAFHNWISTDFSKTFSRVRLANKRSCSALQVASDRPGAHVHCPTGGNAGPDAGVLDGVQGAPHTARLAPGQGPAHGVRGGRLCHQPLVCI